MRKAFKDDDLRPEYSFGQMKGGIRGKYAKRFQAGTNLVRLEPDIAKIFNSDNSVNSALRSLIRLARNQVKVAH